MKLFIALTALLCVAATYKDSPTGAVLPDPRVTPGAHRPLSLKAVCETKWGKDARHVTEKMKATTYAEYRATKVAGTCCEVDHLIPRDLGGADVIENLWPQPWPEARKKDRLEVKLRKLVCARELPLREAQDRIAEDWSALYRDIFEEDLSLQNKPDSVRKGQR
jgi:hypothetical protein